MFEHYLSNKNERATVAPKSNFRELNARLIKQENKTILFFHPSKEYLLYPTLEWKQNGP